MDWVSARIRRIYIARFEIQEGSSLNLSFEESCKRLYQVLTSQRNVSSWQKISARFMAAGVSWNHTRCAVFFDVEFSRYDVIAQRCQLTLIFLCCSIVTCWLFRGRMMVQEIDPHSNQATLEVQL